MLEPLEPRRHLSAAIYVTINKAAVTVRGTDWADRLQILGTFNFYGDPDGGYVISPEGDMPLIVNGQPFKGESGDNSLWVYPESKNWYKPLRVDLGAGDDMLTTGGFPGVSSVTYKLGAGNDRLQVRQSSRALAVDGGAGDDRIGVYTDLDINAVDVAVYPGVGRDSVDIGCYIEHDNDGISGKLLIDDAGGPTRITLSGVRVKRETAIRTRNSTDHVALTGSRFFRPLVIRTGGGVDEITADAATTFKRGATVLAGGDDDKVMGF